jgi:predicted ATPase
MVSMSHARRAANGLRFSRVHLENWRNFGAADVDLAQRVFVVGPNAAGKSNFLDVFRFLRCTAGCPGGTAR